VPPKTTKSTALYRAVMAEVRRRINALGWPMWKCDERSGLPAGYVAKSLHPDTPSGRQSKWETLQNLIDALFPNGVHVEIREKVPATVSMNLAMRQGDSEGARRMATYRLRNMSPERRKKIAKRAARVRWRAVRENAQAEAVR
jgi:hypothetical protein